MQRASCRAACRSRSRCCTSANMADARSAATMHFALYNTNGCCDRPDLSQLQTQQTRSSRRSTVSVSRTLGIPKVRFSDACQDSCIESITTVHQHLSHAPPPAGTSLHNRDGSLRKGNPAFHHTLNTSSVIPQPFKFQLKKATPPAHAPAHRTNCPEYSSTSLRHVRGICHIQSSLQDRHVSTRALKCQ